jgi:hypothetical protein
VGRFDPLSGRFRVRYAANRPAAAARERFPARTLTDADGELFLVGLDSLPSALNLTVQANLDALGLDDRVSTGRIDVGRRPDPDPLLETCGRLADAVYDWWRERPPPLLYRARSAPSRGRSIAFTQTACGRVVSVGRLRDATALHSYLVLRAGFTVPTAWLA